MISSRHGGRAHRRSGGRRHRGGRAGPARLRVVAPSRYGGAIRARAPRSPRSVCRAPVAQAVGRRCNEAIRRRGGRDARRHRLPRARQDGRLLRRRPTVCLVQDARRCVGHDVRRRHVADRGAAGDHRDVVVSRRRALHDDPQPVRRPRGAAVPPGQARRRDHPRRRPRAIASRVRPPRHRSWVVSRDDARRAARRADARATRSRSRGARRNHPTGSSTPTCAASSATATRSTGRRGRPGSARSLGWSSRAASRGGGGGELAGSSHAGLRSRSSRMTSSRGASGAHSAGIAPPPTRTARCSCVAGIGATSHRRSQRMGVPRGIVSSKSADLALVYLRTFVDAAGIDLRRRRRAARHRRDADVARVVSRPRPVRHDVAAPRLRRAGLRSRPASPGDHHTPSSSPATIAIARLDGPDRVRVTSSSWSSRARMR